MINPGGRIKATAPSGQPAAVLIGDRIWTGVPKRILDNLSTIEVSVLRTLQKHLPTYRDAEEETSSIFERLRYGNINAIRLKVEVTAKDLGLFGIENGAEVFNKVFGPLKHDFESVKITTRRPDQRDYVKERILDDLSTVFCGILDRAFPKKPRLVLDQSR
ncbi:hypothetical protein HZC35_05740 [Candidatus Saganbacteria bacterium]|nr:hypothetical protein [Candidatus Saganbacteria bacterium]